ncbi:MAG: serine/threonine-protein kinase, partial [Polyangiaceae bacterium]
MRPLATGGMGQVWLANHRGLDIEVAVKFMRREVAEDPVSVTRFEQEAKLAARIKSPHVVEVLDYDVTDTGVPFIVMESLRGQDLETVLENGRTLGISDTARVLLQVCKALTKAHGVGVIHRDIKAENVFVVQDDGAPLIKVLDFGVAKETANAHGISLSGTTVGTPAYMSPEQLFHPKEIDLRTDLWATAVLVYRCLTGSFPFEGESFPSVCLSVSKGKFAPPSAVKSGLPGGLDAWFKKAFHKSLDARFASAAEMSEGFLSELRKADLLPSWVDSALDGVPSRRGSASWDVAPTRRVRSPKVRLMQLSAAVATMLVVGIAPLPSGLTVGDLAGQATEQARLWAANEGLYPSSWPTLGATEGPAMDHVADVTWMPPPSQRALAEREMGMAIPSAGRATNRVWRYEVPPPASYSAVSTLSIEATASTPVEVAPAATPSAPA